MIKKKGEILRSFLIWCLVPMIKISSKSEVFDRYLNFHGELLPPLCPLDVAGSRNNPARFIPWTGRFF